MCCLLFIGDLRALCRVNKMQLQNLADMNLLCRYISKLLLSRTPEMPFELRKHVYSKGNNARMCRRYTISEVTVFLQGESFFQHV